MNTNLELSIRESIAVITGVLHHEVIDYFDQTTETENARALYFKLLMEHSIFHPAELAHRYLIPVKKFQQYIANADMKMYRKCEQWIYRITKSNYGENIN
jgi:hypothetical protein